MVYFVCKSSSDFLIASVHVTLPLIPPAPADCAHEVDREARADRDRELEGAARLLQVDREREERHGDGERDEAEAGAHAVHRDAEGARRVGPPRAQREPGGEEERHCAARAARTAWARGGARSAAGPWFERRFGALVQQKRLISSSTSAW